MRCLTVGGDMRVLLLGMVLLGGCAHGMSRDTVRELSTEFDLSRRQVRRFANGISVAQAAGGFVGASRLQVGGRTHRYDCSGFVNAAYDRAGIDLDGLNSAALFEYAKQQGLYHRRHNPRPGDVVFFDNTWDKNGDRRFNDPLTHVAIVERVDANGTITMVHKGGSGVGRTMMNLRHRHVHREAGVLFNSMLRYRKPNDRRRVRYLTGELWRGFASFWKLDDAP